MAENLHNMARRLKKQPVTRASEIIMDDDSCSEDDADDSADYLPTRQELLNGEREENEGESGSDSDMSVEYFLDPQPSTSRSSGNTRGTTRRGRGARGRGRGRISHLTPREEERRQIDAVWSDQNMNNPPNAPPFQGNPCIQSDIPEDATPWDFYQLFVDDNIMMEVVDQTNLYATQCREAIGDRIGPHSLLADWSPVTYEEIRRFLGLLFLMGIVDKPDIKSYWSTNPHLDTLIFRKSMSRNRFEAILMVFHVVDKTASLPKEDPQHDKLFKIRPLLSHLQNRFEEVYRPQQNLSIDESMMPWRGRVAFRQFTPSKPIRYGIKLYLCCDSSSSYVCKLEVYTGKKGDQPEKDHGPNVVKRFANSFSGLGHTIYIDSFFSSVELFEHLRKQGTTATGTIRKDRRGLPTQLGAVKLQKGETCEMKRSIASNDNDADDQSASLHAVRYNDKKLVTLLSTCTTGTLIDSGKKNWATSSDSTDCSSVQQHDEWSRYI